MNIVLFESLYVLKTNTRLCGMKTKLKCFGICMAMFVSILAPIVKAESVEPVSGFSNYTNLAKVRQICKLVTWEENRDYIFMADSIML